MAQLLPYTIQQPGSPLSSQANNPAYVSLVNAVNRAFGQVAKVVNDYLSGSGTLPAEGDFTGQMFFDTGALQPKWWTGTDWLTLPSTGLSKLVIGEGLGSSPAGTITSTGTVFLAPVPGGTLLGNTGEGSAIPLPVELSAALDQALGDAVGGVAIRAGETWIALSPGTSGYVLTSGGVGVAPSYEPATGGGDLVAIESEGTGESVFDGTTSGTATLRSIGLGDGALEAGFSLSIVEGTIILNYTELVPVTSNGNTLTSNGNIVTSTPT